jgi:sterol desaturase/sphingolipid hydroxylase (fatty acid hydroxylase superfamily)
MKRHHLAHHFHNEAGNFGITTALMDRLCGTYYATRRAVPPSKHVFDLGYDDEQARIYPWIAGVAAERPRKRAGAGRRHSSKSAE